METPDKQNIIFGYYVNDELQGYRQDSFGSLSMDHPKIYGYSPEQIEIIRKNVKDELSHSGSSLLDMLFGKEDEITQNLLKKEELKREWGDFEVRVMLFPVDREEWYDACTEGEEYKKAAILAKIGDVIEVMKFKTLKNEN